MAAIDILEATPEEAPIHEDSELIGEIFRDEAALEEQPSFYLVDLSEDPHGPKRVYARDNLIDTVRWTVDPHPRW